MKWFISILVFFILFIFLFIALPLFTGTKAVGEPEEFHDKISFTCSAPTWSATAKESCEQILSPR